jgi:hypothetical protein
MLLGVLFLLGVILFLSTMSSLDLLLTREDDDPVWLPDLGPVAGLTPRPPLAKTFFPGLTTFPAGARELFREEVLLDTPGDFLMVGPFFTMTSCSAITSLMEMFLAADALLSDDEIEDFLLDFLWLLSPAESLIAFSKILTLSLTGEPV